MVITFQSLEIHNRYHFTYSTTLSLSRFHFTHASFRDITSRFRISFVRSLHQISFYVSWESLAIVHRNDLYWLCGCTNNENETRRRLQTIRRTTEKRGLRGQRRFCKVCAKDIWNVNTSRCERRENKKVSEMKEDDRLEGSVVARSQIQVAH